jgi:outer membrane protein assembly factor BamB
LSRVSPLPRPLVLAIVVAGAACLAASRPGAAQGPGHWPAWRGPLGTGEAPGTNPPTTWSETQNVRWKVKLPGRGSSTPIIWGDRIFLQTAMPAVDAPAPAEVQGGFGARERPSTPHRFMVLCLDRKTGKTLWQKTAKEVIPNEGHHRDHGFASYSPVTDGKVVIVSFGSQGVYCFDLDGNLKWSKDLGRMRTRNGFGEGSSPALHGNTVVITWDHEGEDFIIALDRESGRELWRQVRDEPTTWATPLIVKHGDGMQVITPGTTRVRSYDLATGKVLWEHAGLTQNVIPSPVAAGGMVYLMSGFRGASLVAVKLGAQGDLTDTPSVVWRHARNTPYVPSPLLAGERLYFFSGNIGILSSFHAPTGKPLIEAQRLEALVGVYASPVAAAGRVYLVGRNGATVVLKDGDALEVLATNKLDERIDASPAVVGGELFLRGQEHLYCIAEK